MDLLVHRRMLPTATSGDGPDDLRQPHVLFRDTALYIVPPASFAGSSFAMTVSKCSPSLLGASSCYGKIDVV